MTQLQNAYKEPGIYGLKVGSRSGKLSEAKTTYSLGADYDYKFIETGEAPIMPYKMDDDMYLRYYVRSKGEPSTWAKKNPDYVSNENKPMSMAAFASPAKRY
jgi:hypothetical protein